MTPPPARPPRAQPRAQRADALSNRARILDAAEEVFGQGGESASTEEVARLAGVGVATVFRHFPVKADLLDAVLARRFDRLRERAGRLAERPDAGQALFDMFTEMVTDAPSKIAIAEALVEAGGGGAAGSGSAAGDGGGGAAGEAGGGAGGAGPARRAGRASEELSEAVGVLLRRAQEAGAVRPDVELPELYALLIGMSRAAAYAQLEPDVRTRALGVVFDGLAGRGRA